jgi:7tm Odorant receptor
MLTQLFTVLFFLVLVEMFPVKVDIFELLSLPFKVLKLCGLDYHARSRGITRKQKLIYWMKLFFFKFICFNFALCQVFQLVKLSMTFRELKVFETVLAGVIKMLIVQTGMLVIFRRKAEINKIFNRWGRIDLSRLESKNEHKKRIVVLLLYYKRLHALKVVVCIVTRIVLCFGSIIKYFIHGIWYQDLPLNAWYPFALTDRRFFNFAFCWSCWILIVDGIFLFASDMIICGLVMVLAFQLIILSHDVEKALNEDKSLKPLVVRHCELIKAVHQVNKMFSETFLITVLGSSVMICVGAYFALFSKDLQVLTKFCLLFFMVVFKISFLCHLGSVLNESSESVANVIVLSDWYQRNKDIKLFSKMIQTQALLGCELKAGKFFKLNFVTLLAILNTAYSYFSLLKAIN